MVQCDRGHSLVFHVLAILNHLPISAYGGLLKFDMKIFVNVTRLKIGQLFTQGVRRGHPCTLRQSMREKLEAKIVNSNDQIVGTKQNKTLGCYLWQSMHQSCRAREQSRVFIMLRLNNVWS